jgi:vacuolar-type H+-ATPase subunit C/Vma6
MTGAGRYAELAAATRSFKGELLQSAQLERLIETGSLAETVSAITSGHITSVEESDLSPVETYLTHKVIELTERLSSYAPQDSRLLISLFARSFEFECVKAILNASAARVNVEEALRHIVPAGKFTPDRCKDLIEAHNPTRVVESIEDESFKRFLLPKLTGEGAGIQTISAIDQYYFTRLWAASNLPDPLDAQSAKSLIGEAIDHVNILVAFRTRLMGLDARTASTMMIPVNYGLSQSFDELPEANNTQSLARILEKTRYVHILETATAFDTAAVEYALNRSHAKTCVNTFAGFPFNVGLALAFLFLKNYELRDLFGLINAKANNVPSERALASLILYQS